MQKTFLLIIVMISTLAHGAFAQEIIFITHNLQDQTYRDPDSGHLRGKRHAGKRAFNLEVINELKHMMGNATYIQEIPFARGLDMLTTNTGTAMFNVSRMPSRESLYKWVGPLQTETDYLYGLARTAHIQTLDDARHVKGICVVNGNAHHDQLLRLGFTNIITNNSYENCFQMLERGWTDLTPSAMSTVSDKLRKVALSYSMIHRVPEILFQSSGYIAFSKDVDDTVIKQWQNAFDTLVDSGRYKQLHEIYFSKK